MSNFGSPSVTRSVNITGSSYNNPSAVDGLSLSVLRSALSSCVIGGSGSETALILLPSSDLMELWETSRSLALHLGSFSCTACEWVAVPKKICLPVTTVTRFNNKSKGVFPL